jgi:hypothetical protein
MLISKPLKKLPKINLLKVINKKVKGYTVYECFLPFLFWVSFLTSSLTVLISA